MSCDCCYGNVMMCLQVAKVSLDPARQVKRKTEPKPQVQENGVAPSGQRAAAPAGKSPTPVMTSPSPDVQRSSPDVQRSSPDLHGSSEEPQAAQSPPPKVLNIVRSSKFRHIQGGTMHRSTHIEKLPRLSVAVPGDSDAFQVRRRGTGR